MSSQTSSEPTVWQQLAPIQRRTGHRISLKPYETIIRVIDDPDTPRVAIKCVSLTERSVGFQVNKTGTRLIGFTRKPEGGWNREEITIWDDQPDVEFCRTLGVSLTQAVVRDRAEWAHLCHRPGTDRFPLDNSDRTYEHYEFSTTRMQNHWNAVNTFTS